MYRTNRFSPLSVLFFSIVVAISTNMATVKCDGSVSQVQKQGKVEAGEGEVAGARNAFAFSMYKQLVKENSEKNVFFSPYSISSAMSMVLLGCRGESKMELAEAMKFGDWSNTHEQNEEIRKSIMKKAQGVKLRTANRLFPGRSFTLLPEFLAKCVEYYGSDLQALDFVHDPEGSRKTINDWVLEKTRNKIKELLIPGTITPATVLVLANAIYFKGTWATQFDAQNTMPQDFHVTENSKAKVDMMSTKAKFMHAYDEDMKAKVLELQYQGNSTSMIIVLPDDRFGLSELEQKLDSARLSDLEAKLYPQEVIVKLPKFKLEFESDLVEHFQALGVSSIFGANADLSGITGSKSLFVSAIAHKAFVEVNEEGTEAAAATAVIMSRMAIQLPPEVICDHPFLFFIKHKPTNMILFSGRFVNPDA